MATETLLLRCRQDPRWAAEEITQLRIELAVIKEIEALKESKQAE